jgi:hypothetical protein
MFGAVILSFGLLALAVLNLLCAPLIQCLALVAVVPVLLLLRYELRCTAKSTLSRATATNSQS